MAEPVARSGAPLVGGGGGARRSVALQLLARLTGRLFARPWVGRWLLWLRWSQGPSGTGDRWYSCLSWPQGGRPRWEGALRGRCCAARHSLDA